VNINKHASANKVLISIQLTSDKVRLATKDNGKGFDPAKYHHGIGIRNMLSRVNELGGNMHINSKCGEGTSIRIVFPMNSQTAL
jgi:signal transduction histidine kinase